MPQFLSDFLVLSDGKKVVFSKCSSLNLDEQLIGGFLFACISWHELMFKNALEHLKFQDFSLFFYKKKQFLFIGFTKNRVNSKAARGNLEYLGDKFVETHPNLPVGWSSDLGIFRDFHQEVEKTKKERALDLLSGLFHEF